MRRWKKRFEVKEPAAVPFQNLQKVLVVRLRSFGDCLLTTPCLQILKESYPGLTIDVAVEERFREVFEGNPFIGRVWEIPWQGRRFFRHRLLRKTLGCPLKSAGYDAVLDFSGSMTSRILMRLSRAPIRAGFGQFHLPHCYTHRVPNPVRYFPGQALHNVQFLAGLLRGLGVALPEPLPLTRMSITEDARATVADRLRAAGVGGGGEGFILVQPTATLPSKQWAPERFGELIKRLRQEFGCGVVLTCGRGESAVVQAVLRHAGEALPWFEDLSIRELAALAESAAVFVGCDSGPGHLAAAVGRPACIVFGSSNPVLWRPWGEGHRVIRAGRPCSPCPGRECQQPEPLACIRQIPVQAVFTAVKTLFHASFSSDRPESRPISQP